MAESLALVVAVVDRGDKWASLRSLEGDVGCGDTEEIAADNGRRRAIVQEMRRRRRKDRPRGYQRWRVDSQYGEIGMDDECVNIHTYS